MNPMASASPIVEPDESAIAAHLEALFAPVRGEYPGGLIELRYGSPKPNQSAYFATSPERVAEAVAFAANRNREGANVYVGANPRRPETRGAANDADVGCSFWHFADLDRAEAVELAGKRLRTLPPTMTVTTGTEPHRRVHLWWRLEEPVWNLPAWTHRQRGIAQVFDGDPVINPSRIMRLAGTVNWPPQDKFQRGYRVELVTLRTEFGDERPPVTPEQIAAAYPIRAAKSGERGSGFMPGGTTAERLAACLTGDCWHNAMRDLVAHLAGKGRTTVEILALADHITMPGYTVDQTRREMQTALDGARVKWDIPEPDDDPIGEAGDPFGPYAGDPDEDEPEQLPGLDLAALANVQPKAKLFAIERLAPLGEVTLFTGPGSAGKSLLAQQLATAAAAGLPCLRLAVMATPAIYLTCEDDPEQLHWRQTHICDELGVPMANLAGRLHLISLRGALHNELGAFTPKGTLALSPAYHRLVATIKATSAKIVFLDNLAHLFIGNENDRGNVTQFVNLLNRLAGETGAAVVLLGHPPKPPKPGEKTHQTSGSTAWLNSVRSQFYIDHDLETDFRTLTLGKANYSRKGDTLRFIWRDWAFVHEDDLPPDVAGQYAASALAATDNKLFRACLAERNKQRRHVSEKPTAQNYAPKVFESMPESKGIGRKRLIDAMDRLFRIEAIERGFLWRDTAEGRDIHGLREATGEPRRDSENLSDNLPKTPSENLRRPAENARKHTPYTYGNTGAASAAAPEDDDLDWSDGVEGDR